MCVMVGASEFEVVDEQSLRCEKSVLPRECVVWRSASVVVDVTSLFGRRSVGNKRGIDVMPAVKSGF